MIEVDRRINGQGKEMAFGYQDVFGIASYLKPSSTFEVCFLPLFDSALDDDIACELFNPIRR